MKTHVKALGPISHLVVILVRHEGMPHRGMDIVLNSPISAGQLQAAGSQPYGGAVEPEALCIGFPWGTAGCPQLSREDFLDLSV